MDVPIEKLCNEMASEAAQPIGCRPAKFDRRLNGATIKGNMKRVVVWMTVCCVAVSAVCFLSAATRGHALWKTPTLRPVSYVTTPDTNKVEQKSFPTTGWSSTRAGASVGRTYGDYYVDPMLWEFNRNHPATVTYIGSLYSPTWLWYDNAASNWVSTPPAGAWVPRDPTQWYDSRGFTNWISTRSIRMWLRTGFTPPY